MAKRMTPQLHRSTARPEYRFPAIISGAAQHGLPQAVLSCSLLVSACSFYYYLLSSTILMALFLLATCSQVLERPKSTILILLFLSSSIFQGFKSLWTMPNWCRQSTPSMIWWKNLHASLQVSLPALTSTSCARQYGRIAPLPRRTPSPKTGTWESKLSRRAGSGWGGELASEYGFLLTLAQCPTHLRSFSSLTPLWLPFNWQARGWPASLCQTCPAPVFFLYQSTTTDEIGSYTFWLRFLTEHEYDQYQL